MAPDADALPQAPALEAALAYVNADARATSLTDTGKPSFTIAQAADRLTGGEPGWSQFIGQAATVTYAFRATAPDAMPFDTGGFTRFSAAQITQAELALTAWWDAANIRFQRVGSTSGKGAYSDGAAILFGGYSSGRDGASAFGYYPGSTSSTAVAGDVWVNSTLATTSIRCRGTTAERR